MIQHARARVLALFTEPPSPGGSTSAPIGRLLQPLEVDSISGADTGFDRYCQHEKHGGTFDQVCNDLGGSYS